MKISTQITTLTGGGSDGWDLFNTSRDMIDAGISVIELTIGEHDIRTAQPILDEMHRAATAGHTGYAAIPGTRALRDTVAERVTHRTGVPTTRDNVLITPGGQSALFAAHMAVCDPGDTALFIDPFYATYPGTLRAAGAVPKAIEAAPSHAFQPQAADIARAAHGARSLLINTPNNPTGVVYSADTLSGIADVAQDYDLWLISDEVYDTQVWDGVHLSPRALPNVAERTLVVGSMSKSHAMTGSRIGWVLGPEEVIAHLTNLATHTTYGVAGFLQDAAHWALLQGAPFEAEIAAPFQRRRDMARAILADQNVVGLVPAQGAMYLMLDIRATGLDGDGFANALLDRHHIAVMPGESFGKAAAGHIRVAMTISDAAFGQALQTLCEFAATLAKQNLA